MYNAQKIIAENRGLVTFWVNRYAGMLENRATLDREDLMQEGYCGLLDAAATHDPELSAWSTWASINIRKAIRKAIRGAGVDDVSLDAPAYRDDDETMLLETLADEQTGEVDAALIEDETARAVRRFLADMTDRESADAIRLHWLCGMSYKAVSEQMNVPCAGVQNMIRRGFRELMRNRHVRIWYSLDELTRFHAHKGVNAFHSSGSSVVEDAVMYREKNRKRLGLDA